jgi:hypothetical protein
MFIGLIDIEKIEFKRGRDKKQRKKRESFGARLGSVLGSGSGLVKRGLSKVGKKVGKATQVIADNAGDFTENLGESFESKSKNISREKAKRRRKAREVGKVAYVAADLMRVSRGY